MYKGARGHGGIQTPIYPPSRIAVSGTRCSGEEEEEEEEEEETEPLSACLPAQNEGIALASAFCLQCLDICSGRSCVTACQLSSPGRWYRAAAASKAS